MVFYIVMVVWDYSWDAHPFVCFPSVVIFLFGFCKLNRENKKKKKIIIIKIKKIKI
jgi:hypothetical protein